MSLDRKVSPETAGLLAYAHSHLGLSTVVTRKEANESSVVTAEVPAGAAAGLPSAPDCSKILPNINPSPSLASLLFLH
jgi:hypothetical protein